MRASSLKLKHSRTLLPQMQGKLSSSMCALKHIKLQMQSLHHVLQVQWRDHSNPQLRSCTPDVQAPFSYLVPFLASMLQAIFCKPRCVKLPDIKPGFRHSSSLPEDAALQVTSIL